MTIKKYNIVYSLSIMVIQLGLPILEIYVDQRCES